MRSPHVSIVGPRAASSNRCSSTGFCGGSKAGSGGCCQPQDDQKALGLWGRCCVKTANDPPGFQHLKSFLVALHFTVADSGGVTCLIRRPFGVQTPPQLYAMRTSRFGPAVRPALPGSTPAGGRTARRTLFGGFPVGMVDRR